ncbi:unnamed protein product [Strongylus vulgaris]|uniref:Roadblock/LAMTOR2 domain-containing protein n=1 Tax=Strongylus vulgaris TaxID=40348 RepID=A0A3P7JBZ8_STRVU|nr:unnamed protein product [Strongylus vulgaris]
MDSAGEFVCSFLLLKFGTKRLGRAIRSTLDDESTARHSALLQQLCEKSKSVIRELDGSNDLTFLRLRTKKNEIMIAPDKDYLLAVIENLSS